VGRAGAAGFTLLYRTAAERTVLRYSVLLNVRIDPDVWYVRMPVA